MKDPISVLIADDHTIVRDGLRLLISTEPDLLVVAETNNGKDAVRLTRELLPDIALLDVAMPKLNGVEAARLIHLSNPEIRVIILSMHSDDEYVIEAIKAGISGYIVKQSAASELIKAVRVVHAGKAYFSPGISKTLVNMVRSASRPGKHESQSTGLLSPREKEILLFISNGYTSKEIAAELYLSVRTIEKHRQNIMNKLDIHDVAGLTRYALEKKILTDR
ncbi:MAG: response regulator transcription factor [FCB group bacterium]|nr:response regulator transcription factor [FCB group bacterium]